MILEEVTLYSMNDWLPWIFMIKSMAESYSLWDLIDPEKTCEPLQEPIIPIRLDRAFLPTLKTTISVHELLKYFYNRFAPTQANQEDLVIQQYNKGKLFDPRRHNIEDWCHHFANKDLIRAFKIFKAQETFTKARRQNAPAQIDPECIVDYLTNEFLQYYRATHTKKANIHGGVFATLNGEDSPYNRKRKFGEKKLTKPCPAGDGDSHDNI
ncbi:hypothetical protein M501DRAFT_1025258 [Patellaria atrata CBS 101060]|uniref:Uncharacterized protein n=1 Tax=Patellaria atrata CBS 101060 TaxID=1346257 RepID=A0A9P4VLD3_9PEZI|nr:hypothetical protein M501DRAFT_1025258 [Patellaria atrata CBS 101060]